MESLLNSCESKFSVSIHFSKESGKEEGWELDRRGHRNSRYRKRNAPRRGKEGLQNYGAHQEAGVEEAKGEFEPSPVSQAAESRFTAVVAVCVTSWEFRVQLKSETFDRQRPQCCSSCGYWENPGVTVVVGD